MAKRQRKPGLYVGVDAGGTKIAALVAGPEGGVERQPLGRAQVLTDVTTPERTLDGIVAAIEQALAQAGAALNDVRAIGLGIPGRVEPETGLVDSAVNLRWRQLPAGPLLAERLGVPCRLENDAKTAALGAYQTDNEQRFQNWAYISVGTGIAAGLILGGKLYRGSSGMAGEIGHVIVKPDGPRCACGLRGCLEALASGPAIVREAQARLAAGLPARDPSLLDGPGPLTTARIYAAACAGDTVARVVTCQAGWFLAQAVHSLVMTCDVERVVFGGGVARAGAAFLDPICEALEHLRQGSPLAAEVLRPGLIGLLPPSHEAAVWGAVALAEMAYPE